MLGDAAIDAMVGYIQHILIISTKLPQRQKGGHLEKPLTTMFLAVSLVVMFFRIG